MLFNSNLLKIITQPSESQLLKKCVQNKKLTYNKCWKHDLKYKTPNTELRKVEILLGLIHLLRYAASRYSWVVRLKYAGTPSRINHTLITKDANFAL